MSLKQDKSIGTKLGYSVNYKINNVEAFANTLYNKLNEVSTLKGYFVQK